MKGKKERIEATGLLGALEWFTLLHLDSEANWSLRSGKIWGRSGFGDCVNKVAQKGNDNLSFIYQRRSR